MLYRRVLTTVFAPLGLVSGKNTTVWHKKASPAADLTIPTTVIAPLELVSSAKTVRWCKKVSGVITKKAVTATGTVAIKLIFRVSFNC
jgi:hypothetical protein